jgi:hypothetical protein
MGSEADYTTISSRITNETYGNILKLAQREKIMQVMTVNVQGQKREKTNIVNMSQAVSWIIEQYFTEHPV